jgi:hypothetical protein
MDCPNCNRPLEDREFLASDVNVLLGLPVSPPANAKLHALACMSCDVRFWYGSSLNSLALRVAVEIASRDQPIDPKEVIYCRKTLYLTRDDLATHLGVTADEVKNWETTFGAMPMSAQAFLRDWLVEDLDKDSKANDRRSPRQPVDDELANGGNGQ